MAKKDLFRKLRKVNADWLSRKIDYKTFLEREKEAKRGAAGLHPKPSGS